MTVAWTPPLLLQSHGPSEVWNALVSYCGHPIPLAGKGVTAVIECTTSPEHARVAALVEAASLRAVMLFDSFPFASLFEANIDADDLERLPVAMRDVLIEGMISALWSLIPQNRLPRYSILGIGDWRDSAAEAGLTLDWLAISIRGFAAQPVRLRVGCVAVELARAIIGEGFAARTAWTSLRSKLSVEAFFTLGRMSAPLARVRALAPGDVVVLATTVEDRCMLRLDRELHEFRRSDDDWTYFGRSSLRPQRRPTETSKDAEMQEDSASEDVDQPGPGVSSLMLDLDFDLGATRIALATIETWQVGAIVELDPPAPAEGLEVTLRINGQAVAKGDLVLIDDRIAVRLTRLLISE